MQDINITNIITQTINALCNNLFSSIDNSIYPILDNLIFINSDILKTTSIEKILGTSSSEGLLILANALLVAFVIYYSVRLLFSYYTSSETREPSTFFCKNNYFWYTHEFFIFYL